MTYVRTDAGDWPRFDSAAGVQLPAKNEIHVWLASLSRAPETLVAFENLLTPDERERAVRFRFPEHRSRFIAARGTLRSILGMHLNAAPGVLRFSYGEHGKPALSEPANTGIEFNVSHSADMAIYAVARDFRVGVDIERIKPEGSWLKIAEHYFEPEEAARLAGLPEEKMRREFFALWSQKEALMKAAGTGLRFPLESAAGDAQWQVLTLDAPEGYASALAFEAGRCAPVLVRRRFS